MKPVQQTIFGQKKGNCLPACIASILEIPIDDLPNFCAKKGTNWITDTAEWLHLHGWSMFYFSLNPRRKRKDGRVNADWHFNIPRDALYIAGGKSPRGNWNHACIYRDNELIHDPHPDGTGLVGNPIDYTILVPTKRLQYG